MVITIAGGGSTFTAGIVKSIALRREELEVDEIRLFDINKERQDKVAVVVDWVLHKELNTDIKLVVTTDVQQAYTDASFVFAQMRVGGYAMREQDEKIPLRHGCVGQETCGCGGMAYGMRTIFPMIKLIDDVEKYAKKDYWILNYSNPAAIVSEACRKLRPKARIINICDMPIAIIDVVAAAMGIQNKKEIVYDYFGLNHFGWFTSIQYHGEDLMPKLRAYIKENQILLPESYLKGMGALTSSASQNHQVQLVLCVEGRVRDHGKLPGVPAQYLPELLSAGQGVRGAFGPEPHPRQRGGGDPRKEPVRRHRPLPQDRRGGRQHLLCRQPRRLDRRSFRCAEERHQGTLPHHHREPRCDPQYAL